MTAATRGRKPSSLSADPDALTKPPLAPAWLSSHAKAEWRRAVPELVKRGVLTRADLGAVEAYCAAAGSARQIAEAMSAMPLPDLKMGGLQIRFSTLARQLGAELGLSPVSRSRLGAVEAPADEDDPLAIT